jgi:hypothetical protein
MMIRAPSIVTAALVLTAAAPAGAQSAPALTELQIVSVASTNQVERVAADQRETVRHHTGPLTLIVREKGIGRARALRLDGHPAVRPSTIRPLCGPAVTAGACRPGESMTGTEITYHLGELPRGTTVAVQDMSANLPAQTLVAEITID